MAPRKLEPEEITADIRRVAKLLGKQPRSDEYREHGRFSHSAPGRAFGSWRAAVEAAGLVYQGKIVDPFADLRKVAEKLGHVPSYKEYRESGKHYCQQFYKLAPDSNWISVLVTCFGINEDEARGCCRKGNHFGNYRATTERLEELRQLTLKLRRVPSMDEARKLGINTRILLRRLGGWLKTLEAAGLGKSRSKKRPGEHLTGAECQREVIDVWNRVGRFPTQKEFEQYGRICVTTVTTRVTGTKSWAAVRRLMAPHSKPRKGERKTTKQESQS